MTSKIEWCDETWNIVSGCTKISSGCTHCYAERMAIRLQGMKIKGYANGFNLTLHPEQLSKPFNWKKSKRIFVCSMSDLFHKDVPAVFINKAIMIMEANPQHTFMILTKRPERMNDIMNKYDPTLNNLWLGVSAEDQETADERIPILLQTKAAKRFVSIEPMLEEIDITEALLGYPQRGAWNTPDNDFEWYQTTPPLDWVICGCESGPARRPFNMIWANRLKHECVLSGVPFFFKQGVDAEGNLIKMPELDGRVYAQYPEDK